MAPSSPGRTRGPPEVLVARISRSRTRLQVGFKAGWKLDFCIWEFDWDGPACVGAHRVARAARPRTSAEQVELANPSRRGQKLCRQLGESSSRLRRGGDRVLDADGTWRAEKLDTTHGRMTLSPCELEKIKTHTLGRGASPCRFTSLVSVCHVLGPRLRSNLANKWKR